MARRVGSRGREGHHLALTVHGPLGSIDLLVPPGAAATDVAREYAAQAGLGSIPLISTQRGQPLAADLPLVDGGVDSGDVLVASTTLHRSPTDSSARSRWRGPSAPLTNRGGGPVWGLVLGVASGMAVLAGWCAGFSWAMLCWLIARRLLRAPAADQT